MKIAVNNEKVLKKISRELAFERNGGGQWVCTNRPHKNKKKYDRLYVDFKTKSFDDLKRKYMELRMVDDKNREKAQMNIYAITKSYYL